MSDRVNELGLPIGEVVDNWRPRKWPPREPMHGRYCDVVPLSVDHAGDLFAAYQADAEGRVWTYLLGGPYDTVDEYRDWLRSIVAESDPQFYAIVDKQGKAIGIASYLRINPAMGTIEVGHINYSPVLQRTVAATEAMFLMMKHVFDDLGYRRYEWKCDALNARSRRAAERLGFTFEGVFRQALVYKGRNRDTAWYAIIDKDWPAMRTEFKRWLSPENFHETGEQKSALKTPGASV